MSLDTVSSRTDGEVPNDDSLNELLVALKVLFGNNGLPPASFPWPLVAQGNINMNGFSLLNVTNSSDTVYVNSGTSLATAVGILNGASGGNIIIDSEFGATTSSAGITLSKPMTITCNGGASITLAERSSAGPAITIDSDDVVLTNNIFLTEAPTNTNYSIDLASADRCQISNNTFNGLATPIRLGNGASAYNVSVRCTDNHFVDPVVLTTAGAAIMAQGNTLLTLSGNTSNGAVASSTFIDISAGSSGTMQGGVVANNTCTTPETGTKGITGVSSGGTLYGWTISGNAMGVLDESFNVGGLEKSTVSDNVFGEVIAKGTDCVYSGNAIAELASMIGSTALVFAGNHVRTISSVFAGLYGSTECIFTGNHFDGDVLIPVGTFVFAANYVSGDLSGSANDLSGSAAATDASTNYIVGTVT